MTDKLEQATALLSQWYYEAIRSLADAAIEACVGRLVTEPTKEDLAGVPRSERASARAGFVPYRVKTTIHVNNESREYATQHQERTEGADRREFLQEWVESATDDHNYVTYTHKAQLVVATSRNDGAYEDDIGEKPPTIEAQACAAMRADVWEILEVRSDEWEGEDPEPDFSDDEPDDSRDRKEAEERSAVPSGTLPDDLSTLAVVDLNAFHGMPRARN